MTEQQLSLINELIDAKIDLAFTEVIKHLEPAQRLVYHENIRRIENELLAPVDN